MLRNHAIFSKGFLLMVTVSPPSLVDDSLAAAMLLTNMMINATYVSIVW